MAPLQSRSSTNPVSWEKTGEALSYIFRHSCVFYRPMAVTIRFAAQLLRNLPQFLIQARV
jgi:hypothetical protein